jgi:hypothetical protein
MKKTSEVHFLGQVTSQYSEKSIMYNLFMYSNSVCHPDFPQTERAYICVCVYICVCMYLCVCVCVCMYVFMSYQPSCYDRRVPFYQYLHIPQIYYLSGSSLTVAFFS